MRGLLDTIPEAVLAYLLEHLPQTAPHSDWIPGQLLDSVLLGKLEAEGHSGYVAFALEQDWLGGVLLYQGKPIESWRRALGGMENRAEAYRNLFAQLEFFSLRVFALPSAVVPCVAALTLGTEVQSYDAQKIVPAQMLAKLEDSQFSGAAVLENGKIGQAWLFQKGQRLLEPPLPETFREGRVHLVAVPSAVPEDIVRFSAEETHQEHHAAKTHLYKALQAVLQAHVGDSAGALLEQNLALFAETDLERLQNNLEAWLEETFGQGVLAHYKQQLES